MPPQLIAALDKWAAINEISRSDALRRLVELGLTTPRAAVLNEEDEEEI